MYDGVPYIVIDGVTNVKSTGDLPTDYVKGTPAYYELGEKVIIASSSRAYVIYVGNTYTVAVFDEIIDTMKAAGERLAKVRIESAFVVEI